MSTTNETEVVIEIQIEKKKEKEEIFDDEILNRMLDCKLDENFIPIIYRKENNISGLGLEKMHKFDPSKYMHSKSEENFFFFIFLFKKLQIIYEKKMF